tara:strand:+ start:40295 stop:43144 length:2850 start_codon:yes stop_codon:yes gene_type:complete
MASKRYEAVNSNILGLNEDERMRGEFQLHPLIRSDWKSADRLRDAQGDVPALRTNAENGNLEVNANVQFDGIVSHPFRKSLMGGYYQTTPGAYSKDTKTHVVTLTFFEDAWNAGNIDGPVEVNNLLNQDNPDTNVAGVPYFEKYFSVNPQNLPANNEAPYGLLTTDARMAGATQNTLPLMAQAPAGSGNPILSHKFTYDHYDPQAPASGYNIEIEPKYNRFLDTSPDYEAAISSLSETLIPNFYHVEISTLLSDVPGDSIPTAYVPFALGEEVTTSEYKDVLAGSLSGSDITENQTNSQGYFQFYCNKVSILNQSYTENYGNVAVLSRDISFSTLTDINNIARDNRGTDDESDDLAAVDTYPFYNKITIPYDNQWDMVQGSVSVIEALKSGMSSVFTRGLLLTLELLIIKEFKLGNAQQPPTVPFTIYDTTENNQVIANNLQISLPLRIDAVLEDFLQALDGMQTQGGPFDFISGLLQSANPGFSSQDFATGASTELGASLVTAPKEDSTTPTPLAAFYTNWFNALTTADITQALNIIADYRRSFFPVHRNLAIHNSEAIMYVVEKRVVPAGQTSAAATEPVVQRLFFGRDIVYNQKGAVYYDTQIKYGVRYQYDIKQIRMIIGESYYYDSVVTIANSGAVGQGRALANALGIYAEEAAAFQATETFAISNNLNGFQYTPEDEEPGAVPPSGLQGNYVYKVYPSGDPAAAYYIDQIFGVRTDTTYTLGAYQNSRQIVETDLSLLPLRIKYGPGFDGNNSGGAMPTTALNIYGPLSELPEEEDCPPVGDFLGPEDDPIGDAIDEGIEDSIEEITGAQEAENILIQAGEAEIVVGLQQGPPGQENLLEEFIFSHDSTLTPGAVGGFGGVGPPINDAFEIAQELLNTGVNNAAGASNNAAGNVGNMAYGDFSTGNNVVDDAGNNMAAGNVAVEDAGANLNLINNLLINGLIG